MVKIDNIGKLIGIAKKSGIHVFENIEGDYRTVTSIKNGRVFKQIIKKKIHGKENIGDSLKEFERTGHVTTIKDSYGNEIRDTGHSIKKYKNGKVEEMRYTEKNLLNFMQAKIFKDGKLLELVRIIEDRKLNFLIHRVRSFKIDEFANPIREKYDIRTSLITMEVKNVLLTKQGIRINAGKNTIFTATNNIEKTPTVRDISDECYGIDSEKINEKGVRFLLKRFEKYLRSKQF